MYEFELTSGRHLAALRASGDTQAIHDTIVQGVHLDLLALYHSDIAFTQQCVTLQTSFTHFVNVGETLRIQKMPILTVAGEGSGHATQQHLIAYGTDKAADVLVTTAPLPSIPLPEQGSDYCLHRVLAGEAKDSLGKEQDDAPALAFMRMSQELLKYKYRIFGDKKVGLYKSHEFTFTPEFWQLEPDTAITIAAHCQDAHRRSARADLCAYQDDQLLYTGHVDLTVVSERSLDRILQRNLNK